MKITKISIILISLLFITGCEQTVGWQYPIKLDDSRAEVQAMLGTPDNNLEGIQYHWYSKSGVSIKYDDFDKVEILVFRGAYSTNDWLIYNGPIINNVNMQMDINDLKGRLGKETVVKNVAYSDNQIIYTWKKDRYTIEAVIWANDYSENGKTYPKDSLIQLSIEKSI